MKKRPIFVILLSILLIPSHLFSWWDLGHMTVAHIAYEKLEPEVKEKVDGLVSVLSPYFPESPCFLTAACWADDIGDVGLKAFHSWHGSAKPHDPYGILTDAQKERIVGNLKGNDIIFAIEECIKTLQNPKATPFAKAFMLRFLIHLAGDIHQPLHCTAFYSPDFPNGDRCGCNFAIVWDNPKKTLHAFWDSMCGIDSIRPKRPLTSEGYASIEKLAKEITTAFPKEKLPELKNTNPYDWRDRSFELGQKVAYDGIQLYESPSEAYIQRGQYYAMKQIALAGYRLATLLNVYLK